MPTPSNAIDVSTSGAVSYNGTAFSGSTLSIANGGSNATSFTQSNGIVTYNGTSLVNYAGPQISSGGVLTNTTQPAFLYYLASSTSGVTGDGTIVQLGTATLTQSYDNGSNCTTGGLFTAPVTGVYMFSANAQLSGTEASTTDSYILITAGGVNYYGNRWNYSNAILTSTVCAYHISIPVKLTATQTCVVKVAVGGGATKGVLISGSSTDISTYFSGYLIC